MKKKKAPNVPGYSIAELAADKELFRLVRKKLTPMDKLWLLDCSGDYSEYQQRLRHAAKVHHVGGVNVLLPPKD